MVKRLNLVDVTILITDGCETEHAVVYTVPTTLPKIISDCILSSCVENGINPSLILNPNILIRFEFYLHTKQGCLPG